VSAFLEIHADRKGRPLRTSGRAHRYTARAQPDHYQCEDSIVYTFAARVGRARPMLMFVVATIAGACADDQSITSPRPNSSEPGITATAEAGVETTDATVVTINPNRTGTIRLKSGFVELSGTITCSKAGTLIRLVAYLDQDQRKTGDTVSGYGQVDVACDFTPTTWFIPVAMTYGDPLPQRGRADALFRVLTGGVTAPEVIRSIRLVEDVQN
jgi:hypothetical protein